MNRYVASLGTWLMFVLAVSGAEGPDERYIQLYNLVLEADGLNDSGQQRPALAKYLEAHKGLKEFQTAHASWNDKLVAFRLSYVASKLEPLTAKFQSTGGAPTNLVVTPNISDPAVASQFKILQDEIARLTAKNTLLEAKLKEAFSAQPALAGSGELTKVNERNKALEKENDLLRVALQEEKARNSLPPDAALMKPEKQVAELKAARRQLENENDELKKRLAAANRELARRGGSPVTAAPGELESQLAVARARLSVYEARPVPYSPEELALLNRPAPAVSAVPMPPPKKRVKEPPPGAGALMAQALRSMDAGLLPDAERKLLEVLRQDERNVYVLAVLAGVQVGMKHFEDAERNVKQALAVDPEDAESLYLLGLLRFEQNRLDESLDALSLSARLEPDRADTQLYLGKTLLRKGNLGPAETALRKVLQLFPKAGEAHFALAETYTLQKPPSIQLAQWHYKKALSIGVSRSEDLEKLMDGKKAP